MPSHRILFVVTPPNTHTHSLTHESPAAPTSCPLPERLPGRRSDSSSRHASDGSARGTKSANTNHARPKSEKYADVTCAELCRAAILATNMLTRDRKHRVHSSSTQVTRTTGDEESQRNDINCAFYNTFITLIACNTASMYLNIYTSDIDKGSPTILNTLSEVCTLKLATNSMKSIKDDPRRSRLEVHF